MSRPQSVINARSAGDIERLRRLGSAGGKAAARSRERTRILCFLNEERKQIELAQLAKERNEHILSPDGEVVGED